MNRRLVLSAALALTWGGLAGGLAWAQSTAPAPAAATSAQAAVAPPRPAPPQAACLAELDRLSKGIPIAENGPSLRSQGLRIRTPIAIPENIVTDRSVISAARVRVLLDAGGMVVPGSVEVQASSGDPQLALAMSEYVPATLSFDTSGAFTKPKQFAFTTVYVLCAAQ